MSQYRKGTHVRNQPQFYILSPLYSNPPVWPGAEFVRWHNGWKPKEIPRADLEGLVVGNPMLADGNIIRRFVLSSYMYVMGRLLMVSSFRLLTISVECREDCEASENYHLNVARHAFSCSMRFGPPIRSVCAVAKFLDVSVLSDCQVFRHGHRMGWVLLAHSFWVSF
jgi:hypothetical protein